MRKIVANRPGPPRRLKVQTCDRPRPASGEVLIDVEAAGVNFADCVARMGLYKSSWDLVGWPLTPGFEVAGRVAGGDREIGSGFSIGDRVVAVTRFGGYAEAIAVPRRQVFPVPAHLSMIEAATLPVSFLTALHAVELAAPPPGESVLVHSASGAAGLAITQVARLRGCRVIGIVGAEAKRQASLTAGCQQVVIRDGHWLKQARALAPQGYAAVFDASGDTLARSAGLVAPMGRLVVYGSHGIVPRGGRLLDIPMAAWGYFRMPRFGALRLANSNLSVMAFNLSYLFDKWAILERQMKTILDLVTEHRLTPPPTRVYPLALALQSHADLHVGQTVGKLVLITGEQSSAPAERQDSLS